MRFNDVMNVEDFLRIKELAPPTATGVQTPPAGPAAQTTNTPGMASGQMDPVQAAQAAKERQEQKKQIQDQIKQTEQTLMDLRKKLAELG